MCRELAHVRPPPLGRVSTEVQGRLYGCKKLEHARQAWGPCRNQWCSSHTAQYGLLHEGFASHIPMQVLGDVKGRMYAPDELARNPGVVSPMG